MTKEINATEVFQWNYDAYYNSDKKYIINDGGSRCHAKGTLVRMYDGTTKSVEDIIVGDKVLHPNGIDYNTVIEIHSGKDTMYKIKHKRTGFEDYVCNGNHILALKRRGIKQTGNQKRLGITPKLTQEEKDQWNFISVNDYLKLSKNKQKYLFEELNSYIEYNEQEVTVDPYYIGLWLGDGISSSTISVTIDKKETEIIKYLEDYAEQKELKFINAKSDKYLYRFIDGTNRPNILSKEMSKLDLRHNKHIPDVYLKNSKTNRLKLLAGIIDSDGYNSGRNTYGICMIKKDLMLQIYELIKSLGYYVTFNKYNASMKRNDGSIYNVDSYRIEFNHYNFDELNEYILTPRKQIFKDRDINKSIYHSRFDIEEIGIDEYYGFTLDGDNLFKLASGVIQHNSSKTYSICQLLVFIALQSKVTINVVRKELRVLKDTFMKQDLIPMLIEYGLFDHRYYKGGVEYHFKNGSIIKIYGVPNEERVKGIAGDILYINEGTSLTGGEAAQLMGRTKGKIFIDYNPSMLKFWADDLESEDKVIFYSTYKHNPFLTKSQIKFLESTKKTNPTYYDVYVLGKRGISEFNVYPVWKILDYKPEYFDEYIYGFDYGTKHATTLVRVHYSVENQSMYLEEVLYLEGKSPSEIIKAFNDEDIEHYIPIICDYGGGGKGIILDLQKEGYSAVQAYKGPNSVMDGISHVRNYTIYVDKDSENIQRENVMYRYSERRNSINENPLKINDDTMDAIRYAISYLHTNKITIKEFDGINVY